MKTEEIKTVANTLNELNESYGDLLNAMKGTIKEAKATNKLWRKGNNSMLIKLGLALIAFPDPTISDIMGTALVAAGAVQIAIRRRTLYVEDVYKKFRGTFEQLYTTKHNF